MDTGNEQRSDDSTSTKASVQSINTDNLVKPVRVKRPRRAPPASELRDKATTKNSTLKEPKLAAKHPKYRSMVMTAIESKTSRNGVSLKAILNYIHSTFDVSSNSKFVRTHVKKVLANMVEDCVAILVIGTKGTGYFKLKSSQKSKPKSEGNSNVKANKKNQKKPVHTKSKQSTLGDVNVTYTKSAGIRKSIAKTKSRELGEANTPRRTKKVISSKRKSLLPKNLNRASLLYKRKSISKDSTKKSRSKNSKAKSLDKVSDKLVKTNIQKKALPQIKPKSPKVKNLSKPKAAKSKSAVQNSKKH